MPHVGFCVALGSAATMNNVTESGVLFHDCTTHHDHVCIALVHNCTLPHVGLCIFLGYAMNNVTSCSVLFKNCTMNHNCFQIDVGFAANKVMATETQMEWSAFLNLMFDNALELSQLLTGKLIALLDPTEQ
jgi:hypothetical protein